MKRQRPRRPSRPILFLISSINIEQLTGKLSGSTYIRYSSSPTVEYRQAQSYRRVPPLVHAQLGGRLLTPPQPRFLEPHSVDCEIFRFIGWRPPSLRDH